MLNAHSTATELDRDADMRRNVLNAPLLALQPKVRERIARPQENSTPNFA